MPQPFLPLQKQHVKRLAKLLKSKHSSSTAFAYPLFRCIAATATVQSRLAQRTCVLACHLRCDGGLTLCACMQKPNLVAAVHKAGGYVRLLELLVEGVKHLPQSALALGNLTNALIPACADGESAWSLVVCSPA